MVATWPIPLLVGLYVVRTAIALRIRKREADTVALTSCQSCSTHGSMQRFLVRRLPLRSMLLLTFLFVPSISNRMWGHWDSKPLRFVIHPTCMLRTPV